MFRPFRIFCMIMFAHSVAAAQDSLPRYNIHFQLTSITQQHTYFHSPYEGPKSLQQKESPATSLTATLFAGVRLARHTEFYVNPEMAGGAGLSGATGVAGFANGETFRVGETKPVIIMARMFLRQIIPLSDKMTIREEAANNLRVPVPEKYIAIHAGKLSLADYFDFNSYSHDPREHFMNWALMSSGAWDFAADVRGYTWAVVGEYVSPKWEARIATALLPTEANGPKLSWSYGKSYSWQVEGVRHWGHDNAAALRALVYYNHGPMGSYRQATAMAVPDITATRADGRGNFGWSLNLEQPIGRYGGLFARASWSQGNSETWCFTEIERSLSYGYVLSGKAWSRADDVLGFALVHNGLSPDHRGYLAAGGVGFIIGDGKLNYGIENIFEWYYKFSLLKGKITLSPDYQFVVNPAYNKDRGPVHFFGLRFHTEW